MSKDNPSRVFHGSLVSLTRHGCDDADASMLQMAKTTFIHSNLIVITKFVKLAAKMETVKNVVI
jgi:hypothetical protein